MPRESTIEREDVKALVAGGFDTEKCGRNGRPDRLVLLPLPYALRGYLPAPHVWIEYKQPGGSLTPAQKRRIPKMKERGEVVLIVDVAGMGASLAASWQRAFIAALGGKP
jgi:hypothetical protein